MIKSLEIQNFQSHADSKLEFSSGVNVIVGSSDSGKTAILRALRKLVWNRPTGKAFRSHWGGDTIITAELDNGTVTRNIGKTDEYIIPQGAEGMVFKSFGTSVPEEITKLLNITELNLQSQLDSPFLLTSSPGEVAQHFNRVARIDQIDSSTKLVEKWIRALDQEVKSGKQEIKRLKEELEGFEYLEKFEVELEVLEGMQEKWQQKIQSSQKLKSLIQSVRETEEKITEHSALLPAEKRINELLKERELQQAKEKEKKQLVTLISDIQKVDEEITEQEELLEDQPLVISLLELYKEQEKLETDADILGRLKNNITSTGVELIKIETKLKEMEQKFHDEFPDICPLLDIPCDKLKNKKS